ncbi:MAG TPA: hypothetical protein VI566_12495, partial [Xanthomonadales bacterium]|nr:hypothetical protein [Xanthomonadales bacterium]
WDFGGPPQRIEGYVGYEEEHCYRVELQLGPGMDGLFCSDVYFDGSMEYQLHGSSVNTGRDCYANGYIDSNDQWSNTCSFQGGERFEAHTQVVNSHFCGVDD